MTQIYTRFFTKAMKRMELIGFEEPMLALRNQGMVLGEDNEKMSKSRGNVVAPDDLVQKFGADTVRVYLMFFTKWEQGGPWNYDGIKGPQRLLNDVWAIATTEYEPGKIDKRATRSLRRKTHQVIRKVTHDLEDFSFNTAVAALMELRNALLEARKAKNVTAESWNEAVDDYLLLLAPIAPHITEELWALRGGAYSVHTQSWPTWDEEIAKEDLVVVPVQVNGKVRDRLEVAAGTPEDELKGLALASANVQKHLGGQEPRKVIVVKGGRLVNIVK
jgi:leucyl-tRNA synthetase